nr:MAG TPA: Major capsid protein [Bacteriophage sp.]
MSISNFNLRKRLGMKLAQDDGAGNGGAGSETNLTDNSDGEGEGTEETNSKEEKTFTQADVDKLIKERLAREKKGQPSKEELEAFNNWKESQKTEEEKKNEALTNAEKAKQDAEDRANTLEAKVTCLSKGVLADSVDDVVILAKAMVSEEVTMDQAVDKILEKYPSFKGVQQQDENLGFIKVGAGDDGKKKENINDALSRAFGNK